MVKRGCVVFCTNGRDKGKFMVVLETQECFVFIADGKRRKIENPKRKNMKHVEKTEFFLEEEMLLTNRKLKRALGEIS